MFLRLLPRPSGMIVYNFLKPVLIACTDSWTLEEKNDYETIVWQGNLSNVGVVDLNKFSLQISATS